jgi:hypothetical protein
MAHRVLAPIHAGLLLRQAQPTSTSSANIDKLSHQAWDFRAAPSRNHYLSALSRNFLIVTKLVSSLEKPQDRLFFLSH